MDYYGVGYSNIRLPNSSKSYIYKYDQKINQFPEEVFLHEFLHSLERTSIEYGYKIPALHSNEQYGYRSKDVVGLRDWYRDYMIKNIKSQDGYIGLPNEVYTLKPAKSTDFINSKVLDNAFNEPKNILEEVILIVKNIFSNIKDWSRNESIGV